jgi:hypothetical protein
MLNLRFIWARTRFKTSVAAWLALATILLFCSPRVSAQEQLPAGIGRIEGDNIEVKTRVGAGIESHFAPTVVASGSEVTLSDGNGRILLDTGGEISICGPAHFTVFRSGDDVTLALDYGRVHPSIEATASLTIFTPIIVATPIAIAGAHRDTTMGLDQHGAMCIVTGQGAMRIQQQLSEQSLVIPQGNSANLVDGQVESLHADAASCACQYSRPTAIVHDIEPQAFTPVELPPSSPNEIAAITPPRPRERTETAAIAAPAPPDQPVYRVDLPPLSFDKSAPEPPPDPSPESIALFREVRVQPEAEFHGHVNPVTIAALQADSDAPPSTPKSRTPDRTVSVPSHNGLLTHLRNFFRAVGGHPPCAGSGCSK